MIKTSKFTMLHMPKTGGNWLRKIIENNFDDAVYAGHAIEHIPSDIPSFVFIRHPLTWYQSVYNFSKFGSDLFEPSDVNLLLPIDNINTFEDFILLCNTNEGKANAICNKRPPNGAINEWLHNDLTYYETFVNRFTKNATKVGLYESISTDFTEMLTYINCMNENIGIQLKTLPPINVTNDNCCSYTTTLSDLVIKQNINIINKFYI